MLSFFHNNNNCFKHQEYPECNFRMINVSYDNNNIDTNTIKDVSYNTSNTKKQKKKPIKTLLEELTVGEPEVEVIEGIITWYNFLKEFEKNVKKLKDNDGITDKIRFIIYHRLL
ncbi:8441_t:CDS:2 [Entrophospora sp. SA101]|nr:8441_t:CDS:2 [Entrophospora sp. SA101]